MKHYCALAVLIGVATCIDAGPETRMGGYAQNLLTAVVRDSSAISDAARLRLEGYWDYGRRAGIEAHVLVAAALQPLDPFANVRSGSVMERSIAELTALVLMRAPAAVASLTDSMDAAAAGAVLDYLPYTTFFPRERVTLDRALLKYYFGPFDLFIGRQMIAWGTGYGFNPTDVWNRKDPLDPTAPKAGVTALRAEVPLGALSGLSLVLSPGPDPDHTSGGFRLKSHAAGFDVSVCGMKIMDADRVVLGLPKKIIAGMDMAGQILDAGVWMETAVTNPVYGAGSYTSFDSLYAQVDCGGDYTFENGLYVLAEYLYNGPGKPDASEYGGMDLVRLIGGDMSGFGSHYLMAGVSKTVFDFYTLAGYVLTNASDRSAMLLPSITYLFSDNLSLEASGSIGAGDRMESEYGSVYPTVSFEATGYF